jgi:HAD superfamily hydrolase (TIGR01549 family)
MATARELALPVPTDESFHRLYGRLEFPDCVAAWCGDGHFAEFNQVYLEKVRYTAIGDVDGLLERIGRMRMRAGLITNSLPEEAARKLSDAGVSSARLDFVVTPSDLPVRKPDLTAFISVLERYGIDPAHAVYVSDHPADGRGARGAGLTFMAVLTGAWARADFRAAGIADEYVFATVHNALSGFGVLPGRIRRRGPRAGRGRGRGA